MPSPSACSPPAGDFQQTRSSVTTAAMLDVDDFLCVFICRIPLWGGVLITITDTFVFLFLDKYGKSRPLPVTSITSESNTSSLQV